MVEMVVFGKLVVFVKYSPSGPTLRNFFIRAIEAFCFVVARVSQYWLTSDVAVCTSVTICACARPLALNDIEKAKGKKKFKLVLCQQFGAVYWVWGS